MAGQRDGTFERRAVALAGRVGSARDASELAAAVAASLHAAGERLRVRLWRLVDGRPVEAARHPVWALVTDLDLRLAAKISEAPRPLRSGDALLVRLRSGGRPVGILELQTREKLDPALLELASDVVGARLESLASPGFAYSQLLHVPMDGPGDEVEPVVAEFAAQAKRQLDHDRLSVYLLTPDGSALDRLAVATSPPIPGEAQRVPLDDSGLTDVIRRNEGLVSADVSADERLTGREDRLYGPAGFHSIVSVPLRLGGHAFGVLNFTSRKRGFYSETDLVSAQQISDQIAVFLQNLRLQQAIRVSVRREAVERERDRLAREFHDTLAQDLAGLAVNAQELAARLEEDDVDRVLAVRLHRRLTAVLEDLRRSLFDMVPRELEEQGLEAALEQALDETACETGLAYRLSVSGETSILGEEVCSTIFRVVQESVTNVRKHARARTVEVGLVVDDGVRLDVRDDGCWQDPESRAGDRAGFGLASMRRRAEALGGSLVVSHPGDGGTEIVLMLPLTAAAAASTVTTLAGGPVRRVLLVDDHRTFREGMRALLDQVDDIRIVAEAGTVAEAAAAAKALRPDVVLLDFALPDGRGANAVRAILTAEPHAAVLMFSAFASPDHVALALEAGARGFVAKSCDSEAVVEAIRAAAGGASVVNAGADAATFVARPHLTDRELEIVALAAKGKTNSEIGRALGYSVKTVERDLESLRRKLGAATRAHATAIATSRNLVEAG
jgi:signal transduction histidine kinase/DNA-binding NarL/FixJ family response regulator